MDSTWNPDRQKWPEAASRNINACVEEQTGGKLILRRGTFATTLACCPMSAGQCSRRGRQNDHAGRFDLLA